MFKNKNMTKKKKLYEKLIHEYGVSVVNKAIKYYVDKNMHATSVQLINRCEQIKAELS